MSFVSLELTDEDRALCAHLLGHSAPLTDGVLAAARRHRVHLILAMSLAADQRTNPGTADLSRELKTAAALDAWSERELRTLLDGLAAARIDALLLKGAGLAYTVYPASYLRPRVDIDLLVRRDTLAPAEQVFAAQGWTRAIEREVELSGAQRHYLKIGPTGSLQHLDVHWRIANPRVFANALSFDELRARAIEVPALGRHACTLGPADALFLACLHRVAHHDDDIQLLWLWDIHLLVERLTRQDTEQFLRLAGRESMCAVCRRGLELAVTCFETTGARQLVDRLRDVAGDRPEASAGFLTDSRRLTVLRSDVAALPRWSDRASLVAEHLFPSRAYMRSIYPGWPRVLLPLAYAHRIARGAPTWWAERSSSSRPR